VVIEDYAGWLLIAGVGGFLVLIKPAFHQKKIPRPPAKSAAEYQREITSAQLALGVFAVLIGSAAWFVSQNLVSPVAAAQGAAPTNVAPAQAAAPFFPGADELRHNWPRFRGPGGLGISAYTNVPMNWNVKSGENVLWQADLGIISPSSPVVWGDRIFLTSATASNRVVSCFDAGGKLLWEKPVNPPRVNNEPPSATEDIGGFAASTPCTDGRRVYALFANGDIAAFDFSGQPAWARNLGRPDNMYGFATSLEMYQGHLLVQYDQGQGESTNSFILALDCASGKTIWQSASRKVPSSWATPAVFNDGKRDLFVTCADPWIIAYDPAKGSELWRVKGLGGDVLPCPVFGAGLVFAGVDGEKLFAIKPDGSGDVTSSGVVWSAKDDLPDIPSPLCDGQRLYLLHSGGKLTCLDAASGKKLWSKDLDAGFKASPALAGDRLYVTTDEGVCIVVQAGPEFKELARSELGEPVLASPAFADGRIYLRGKQHLFCLGKAAP